jgi:hypothetical protein
VRLEDCHSRILICKLPAKRTLPIDTPTAKARGILASLSQLAT